MKKITALFLAFVLLIGALPISMSALSYSAYDYVFSAYANVGFDHSTTAKLTETELYYGAYPYYHLTAEAGAYNNTDLVFSLVPKNIAMSDRPFIKICYRTNSPATTLDVSMDSSYGENWLKNHPRLNSNEKFNTIIVNYYDINASSAEFPDDGARGIALKLKPFGAQSYSLDNSYYFDINYVAFFETRDEAEKFTYNEIDTDKNGYTYDILTSSALYSKYASSNKVETTTYHRISANESYVRYLAAPGTYSNNLVINFSHDAFPILEKPYVKICYRTDSPSGTCDISMHSEGGENWLKKMPAQDQSGKWATFIYNVNDMTGNSSSFAPSQDSTNISLRLKPWGAGNFSLSKESYYDIKYIGFFATQSEAESFYYPGDSKYTYVFEHEFEATDYFYASKPKVMKYIKEADARRDEILYTNNTVPYENHLTLSGVSGEYVGTYKDSSYKLYAQAGSYGSGDGKISFTQNDVNFSEFPFVKIGYTTNSTYSLQAAYKNTSGNEAPLSVNDGVINLSGTSNMKSLEIMPFGTGARTLSSDMYCSIAYIGIFKTEAEARAYTYKGENADNMVGTHIIYTANLLNPESTAKGQVVFVSSSMGNDSNSGASPDAPIKTIDELNKRTCYNCVVYFKRGDTFRITSSLTTQHDTVYTSYGYGEKPTITGAVDGKGADKWSATSVPNVWKFNQAIANNTQQGDIGNICINGGELWGIKVVVRNNSDLRVDNGYVFNGRTYIPANSDTLVNGGLGLTADLEYHHNYDGELYLYCADGNPGEVFDSIEIADKGHIATGTFNNTVIDNIHATGGGSHGFGYGSVNNSAVTNCHLDWIGGSIQQKYFGGSTATVPTRYGNAVEAFGSAVNFTIANCFASQIYDCCWTVQNTGAVKFINVEMYDNVSEYANSGLEIWQNGGITDNLYLHDNYTRYGGYGWSHQRPNKDGNFFYGGTGMNATTYRNCSIENNVNILASAYSILAAAIGSTRYNFNNNIYIMAENKNYSVSPFDTEHGNGSSITHVYNYSGIQHITSCGSELGSTFYFVPNDIMEIGYNPYEVFSSVGDNLIYDIVADADNLTLVAGETYNLNLTIYPAAASKDGVYFSSSNSSIASVDQNGKISANYPGKATIYINSIDSEVTETVSVFVVPSVEKVTLYSNISDEAVKTSIVFIGDEFFLGDKTVADKLSEKYFIDYEVSAKRGASVANASIDELTCDISINPELIALSFGYNDYKNGTDIQSFKHDFLETVHAVRESFPLSTVIYITPPRLEASANSLGYTLGDYVDAVYEICDKNYIGVADFYHNASKAYNLSDKDGNLGQINPGYFTSDGIPTEKGAELLANDLVNICATNGLIGVIDGNVYPNRFMASTLAENVSYLGGLASGGTVHEAGKIYLRTVSRTATQGNDNVYVQFAFPNADFDINEYPIMKVYYRSNVADASAKIDLNVGIYKGGEVKRLWSNSGRIGYTKDGELNSFTVDLSSFLYGGDGVMRLSEADKGTGPAYIRLKYYDYSRPIAAGDFFDVESIGFYSSLAEAELDGVKKEEPVISIRGDVNRDGEVDIWDFILLSRYNAGWYGYTENLDFIAADVDYDGYINSVDSTYLARHVAKWVEFSNIPE